MIVDAIIPEENENSSSDSNKFIIKTTPSPLNGDTTGFTTKLPSRNKTPVK